MKKCANCGLEYEDNAQFCLQCGQALVQAEEHPDVKPVKHSKLPKILYILLIIILLAMNVFYIYQVDAAGKRKQSASDALAVYTPKADFLDEYIVLYRPDDPDACYHYYGCSNLGMGFTISASRVGDNATVSYSWSDMNYQPLNYANAIASGIPPCPDCVREVTQIDGNVISVNVSGMSEIDQKYGWEGKKALYEMLPAFN